MNEEKNGVVIYQSMYNQFCRIAKKHPEEAKEYLVALVKYGFTGELPDEDSDIWLYGFEADRIAIDNAAVRYLRAQENGNKGGRPTQRPAYEELQQKYEELKTWSAVAKYYGVTDRTVRGWREAEKTGKNQAEKTSGNFPETEGTGKNHDIDIDIDIEKEKENPASASSAPNCPVDFDVLGCQVSANHADQIMREYATAAAKEKTREVITSHPTDNSRQYVSDARAQELQQRFAADGFDAARDDWVPSTRSEAFADLVGEGFDEGSAAFVVDRIMGLAQA